MSASRAKRKSPQPGGAARLQIPTDPAIEEYLKELRAKYGNNALPINQLRQMVDEAMGTKTLTEILFEMREQSY